MRVTRIAEAAALLATATLATVATFGIEGCRTRDIGPDAEIGDGRGANPFVRDARGTGGFDAFADAPAGFDGGMPLPDASLPDAARD